MPGKEDPGLSLSLSLTSSNATNPATVPAEANHRSPLQLNLMAPSLFPSSSSSSSLPFANPPFASASTPRRNHWLHSFSSSDRTPEELFRTVGVAATGAGDPRSFLRGIDVNRLPTKVVDDEEPGMSSPNSTISSSLSGKRSEREIVVTGVDNEAERDCSREISDDEDGDTSRKKLRLSKDQSAILEESFKEHNTLNPKQKLVLAKKLGLRPRQVEVWFQNRRARTKLKQTEVDCEFLKRCCEQLTDDNRRLQKEVQELRALKMSPQFYMQLTPPTTLTMCPSCERVATPAPSSAPTPGVHHRGLPWGVGAPAGIPFRAFEGLRPRS